PLAHAGGRPGPAPGGRPHAPGRDAADPRLGGGLAERRGAAGGRTVARDPGHPPAHRVGGREGEDPVARRPRLVLNAGHSDRLGAGRRVGMERFRSQGRRGVSGGLATLALLVALAAGCHGKGSREFWRGITTGSSGDCAPLSFNISIDEGRIEGYAVSELPQQGVVSWDVKGSVTSDDRVTIETLTQDPRIQQQRVAWTGTWKPFSMPLVQTSPGPCQPPRSTSLGRP